MQVRILLLALLGLSSAPASAEKTGFETFHERCEREGKRLWGRALCAPVVTVNPATGQFRTSKPAPAKLPAMRANTAFKWGGEDWIMILDPLPQREAEKLSLLFHEAWHVHQQQLGLPANTAVAGHLDDATARYLMRLEWAALTKALRSRGSVRRAHIAQALAFRARRIADVKAATAERDQMRHEGLAAYTGAALSGAPLRLALAELGGGAKKPSLSRSFAYVNGPAWGFLLDDLAPGWRTRLGDGRDLPDLIPVRPAAIVRADDYGGGAILAEETRAGVERAARLAAALSATAENKALRLPLAQMSMDFDPNRVTAAPDGSSLYGKITLGDRWGRIRVDGTPLRIASDFTTAFAPWPLATGALELAPGWKVEERAEGGARLVPPS